MIETMTMTSEAILASLSPRKVNVCKKYERGDTVQSSLTNSGSGTTLTFVVVAVVVVVVVVVCCLL